jgi:hypothetical protein
MPLSYNTTPPSAFRYLHIAVCTEPHRICDHVLSKPLAFQTFQNHFLRFPMANSCPSLDVNPDGPSHQLEPGTRQHCFSTLHISQTNFGSPTQVHTHEKLSFEWTSVCPHKIKFHFFVFGMSPAPCNIVHSYIPSFFPCEIAGEP